MNSIYIKNCGNVNLFLINMQKIDKKSQILLDLVDELMVTTVFRAAFENVAKKLKINAKEKEKILNNNFPNVEDSFISVCNVSIFSSNSAHLILIGKCI